MKKIAALAAALMLTAGASAGVMTHTFDLSGLSADSSSFFGSFPTLQHDFGVAGSVVMVDFDLTYTSFAPSWNSESIIFVDGSFDGLGEFIVLDPSDYGALDAPGVFSYDDSLATSIASDGVVSVTLVETFNDASVTPDSTYAQGSFVRVSFVPVPAPSAMALLGVAGLVGLRRRR